MTLKWGGDISVEVAGRGLSACEQRRLLGIIYCKPVLENCSSQILPQSSPKSTIWSVTGNRITRDTGSPQHEEVELIVELHRASSPKSLTWRTTKVEQSVATNRSGMSWSHFRSSSFQIWVSSSRQGCACFSTTGSQSTWLVSKLMPLSLIETLIRVAVFGISCRNWLSKSVVSCWCKKTNP